jgi:hypothetical protein
VGKIRLGLKVNFRGGGGLFIRATDSRKRVAVGEIADVGEEAARELAPFRTGALRGSIHGIPDGNVARLFSTDPKAQLLEEGSPEHFIEGNPWLKFYWEREGRDYEPGFKLGKSGPDIVNHPGFDGFWFMEGGWDAMCAVTDDVVARTMGL